jgi:hypothetical protein
MTMLTKEQANAAAESVLAQERARSAVRSNLSLRGFPDLEALAPELRPQVLREARREIRRSLLAHAAALSWVAAYASVWYFLVPAGDQHSAAAVFALAATLPLPFFYGACVRRRVRKLARSMATGSGSASGASLH